MKKIRIILALTLFLSTLSLSTVLAVGNTKVIDSGGDYRLSDLGLSSGNILIIATTAPVKLSGEISGGIQIDCNAGTNITLNGVVNRNVTDNACALFFL